MMIPLAECARAHLTQTNPQYIEQYERDTNRRHSRALLHSWLTPSPTTKKRKVTRAPAGLLLAQRPLAIAGKRSILHPASWKEGRRSVCGYMQIEQGNKEEASFPNALALR
jgi:hypothetical protein